MGKSDWPLILFFVGMAVLIIVLRTVKNQRVQRIRGYITAHGYARENRMTKREHPTRDQSRIQCISEKLTKAWECEPDWRLGQLISNLMGPGPHDVFYLEDEKWEVLLDEFLKERKK